MEPAFRYRASLKDIHDGDTVTVDIDLGLGIWARSQKIRLFGINAPELKRLSIEPDGAGEEARDFLARQCPSDLIIETRKDDKEKYGRWLGVLWAGDLNLNDLMLHSGHAVVDLDS